MKREEEESSFYHSSVSTTSNLYDPGPEDPGLQCSMADKSPPLPPDQPAGFKRTSQFSSESVLFDFVTL